MALASLPWRLQLKDALSRVVRADGGIRQRSLVLLACCFALTFVLLLSSRTEGPLISPPSAASPSSASFRRVAVEGDSISPLPPPLLSPSPPRLPRVPIYAHDDLLSAEGKRNLILAEKAKVLYCAVPKAACSQTKMLMSRLLGYTGWEMSLQQIHQGQNETVSIGGLFWHEMIHWPSLADVGSIAKAEEIMADPSFTRFIVVRDPVERFVSAFVDKCLLPAMRDEGHNWNCPVQTAERSNITAVFLELRRQSENSDKGKAVVNEHFRPQSLFCDVRSYRDRFLVFPYSQLRQRLQALAEGEGLVEKNREIWRQPAPMKAAALASLHQQVATMAKEDAERAGPAPPKFVNGTMTQEEKARLVRLLALAAAVPGPSYRIETVKEAILSAAQHIKPYDPSEAKERVSKALADTPLLRKALDDFYREDYLLFSSSGF